ncbi:penicillin-binding protein [Aquibacillus saliphilus]|uniref:penicillin-binding protein n=1 Tax=Aquibacillus saliphilus TaxID=1909422 RepID=UPI0034E2514B
MKKNKTTKIMSSVLMFVFAVVFLILAGRFLYIQGTGEVAGVSLQEWADEKRTSSYELQAERGTIYDRNGMELAQDRAAYRLYAIVDEKFTADEEEPKHVENPQHTAEVLAPLLNIEASEMVATLEKGINEEKFQVEFGANGKDLSQEKRDEIAELDLPGIQFTKEPKRYYPNGMFASHIIGLAQKKEIATQDDNGDEKIEFITQGVNGIEKQLDESLKGVDGRISYKRDRYNTKLIDPEEVITEEQDGKDVYLTIDQKIQTLLEDAMSQVEEQYDPERMTAIVMDPKTGEIVAMSNRPSYNPNQLGEVENWYNDAIATPFEPGSTMKIFTLAAAIEEGVYNPNETYQSGRYQNDSMNIPIHDHKRSGWGQITFEEGIQRSSNVAAAKLAWEKLGPDRFLEYLEAFGFNQPTGIDLPGEKAGKILYNWPLEKITASYGQGSVVTPIQQMMAATAIANDGSMVKPYVISKVVDSTNKKTVEEKKPEVVDKPISKETAKQVRDILGTVVTSDNGTGKMYKLNDYSVAGKTGTAQMPNSENRGYLTGNENHVFSFLGMAPKDKPELMIYVSVKRPNLDVHEAGSQPVSFIFKNVMENSLHYLNIQPDKDVQENIHTVKIPDVVGNPVDDVKSELNQLGLNVIAIGNGNAVKEINPVVGEDVLPNEKAFLITEEPQMPDLTGWSIRDVMRLGELLNLEVEVNGSGFANSQSIEKGKVIKKGGNLVVEFTPPKEKIVDQEEDSNE